MAWKTAKLKNLAKALLSIKQEKDMLAFLRDLCTLEELKELSSRWQAAQMLNEGATYTKITPVGALKNHRNLSIVKSKMSDVTMERCLSWFSAQGGSALGGKVLIKLKMEEWRSG